jgi:cephalosporin-C deacetylase-like acetyl esterase
MRLIITALAMAAVAADFKDVNPNVIGPDDPRTKGLPGMMAADAKRRMQEACLRESKAFAAVKTLAEWEKYRDERIRKLKVSLGVWPEPSKDMRLVVTREFEGDGFLIRNILYESRPGLWVTANLYLPARPPAKMAGILLSHSHHTPKTHGELQDMGMTWARSGVAVLVPDHLGHGERRQHDFATEKDYDKPFRVSRQDYYFRYNSNLQLSAAGESLMGWMVWDLMCGIDALLKQENVDKDRIILLGAVAGGGDPAGVTAALDPRIACVVPFNFGGWQPESRVTENPDRDFAWFGEGYWESTRGLRNGARDGFAHFVIVGSVAPRMVLYAHEFAWDARTDPAWPRLQKIFELSSAKDSLRVVHGKGAVTGPGGPDNTHCTHIGAVHRKGIYTALKDWFGMPVPEEYSKRRPAEELMCWTDEAKKELKPKKLGEVLDKLVTERTDALNKWSIGKSSAELLEWERIEWSKVLGNVEPVALKNAGEGRTEELPGGSLTRFALEPEPGIVVPLILITPAGAKGKSPVVVMVAQGGKAGFLKERGAVIEAFLKAGIAVCLPDVRGTGETQPGTSAERGSSRTSVSQTNLILGQTVIGSQVRDLRAVVRWLKARDGIDAKKLALWGDSFSRTNSPDAKLAVPLDASLPTISEPGGGAVASLASAFEDGVAALYTRGQLNVLRPRDLFGSAYVYYPHDAIVPGVASMGAWAARAKTVEREGYVDGENQRVGGNTMSPAEAGKWVIEFLPAK